jgi:L-seryl-tRNA(Ser) seleniumtransferase
MTETSDTKHTPNDKTAALLRCLPSVDAVLHSDFAREQTTGTSHTQLADYAREILDELRTELRSGAASTRLFDLLPTPNPEADRALLLAEVLRRLDARINSSAARALQRVINATGVILHTNLGRAPLSDHARRRIADEAGGYCTLEYDLATGERGRRAPRVEELLVSLTEAQAALVVNNCAAATLLVLAALAADGETIISRGELVEIGGDFRIPDVMRTSGTRMIEVGTTNRTRSADYEAAITPQTRLVARVHPSNFRVVGFTSQPSIADLAALAHKHNLPLYEDAGSGALYDLSPQGLTDEPVIRQSVRAGADVVSFSGDKLLGGPQAGIIVGRSEIIEHIRRTPLARALRADKLVLGALEATLEAHARGTAHTEIPALRMLHETYAVTRERATKFLVQLRATPSAVSDGRLNEADASALTSELIEDTAAVGGGSAPLASCRPSPSRCVTSRFPPTSSKPYCVAIIRPSSRASSKGACCSTYARFCPMKKPTSLLRFARSPLRAQTTNLSCA